MFVSTKFRNGLFLFFFNSVQTLSGSEYRERNTVDSNEKICLSTKPVRKFLQLILGDILSHLLIIHT